MCNEIDARSTSRRAMIRNTAAAGLSLPTLGMVSAMAEQPKPASIQNPQEALDALMAGNKRFIGGDMLPHDHQSAQRGSSEGQSPFAAFIRCADSRVAPEIVFDQSFGELFVCGVAGNIPTEEIVASLEYAVAVLHTPLIVIMGHSNCGAVDAAIKHENSVTDLPGNLPGLISQILPASIASADSEDRLNHAIKINVQNGVKQLPKDSPVISDAIEAGTCSVVGGVYDLHTGRFTLVD
ncbi:MAG: carbonic anhydrase [Phycisphaerales bacterium]|nr:carbonic anhydrase [Phycisphaerales bacterium]